MPSPAILRLKPSRHFPFLARHPWVHSHALAEGGETLTPGQVVDLADFDGNWLARGMANPASRLRVRLYAFEPSLEIGEPLWRDRLSAAIRRRRFDGPAEPDAAERLVFSESDLLSGLIVDRYADCLSVQFTSAVWNPWRDVILDQLVELTGCARVFARVDEKTAKLEGMPELSGWVRGDAAGEIEYRQNGLRWSVELNSGQKTGGYLDQRRNHGAAAGYLRHRRVLDVCCYHGGFGLVAAARGAADVTGIDSSEAALEMARRHASRNDIGNISFRKGDCFEALKTLAEGGESFDAVVLDPPRFAGSRRQLDAAMRAYTRLNSLAVDLLPPGGILVTCSCSGRVSRGDFLNVLADVGRRRRRDLVVLETRGPAPDHPVAVACPESDYLKCVIAEVR